MWLVSPSEGKSPDSTVTFWVAEWIFQWCGGGVNREHPCPIKMNFLTSHLLALGSPSWFLWILWCHNCHFHVDIYVPHSALLNLIKVAPLSVLWCPGLGHCVLKCFMPQLIAFFLVLWLEIGFRWNYFCLFLLPRLEYWISHEVFDMSPIWAFTVMI